MWNNPKHWSMVGSTSQLDTHAHYKQCLPFTEIVPLTTIRKQGYRAIDTCSKIYYQNKY